LIIEENEGECKRDGWHNDFRYHEVSIRILLYLFSCGPLVLTLAACIKVYRARGNGWLRPIALIALAVTSVIAGYSAAVSIYYGLRPTPSSVPPWKDPFVLDMALLFLLAPIAGVLGLILAGKRAAPIWLIAVIEIASVPLFLLGIMACLDV
jgi:hypothetical protein